MGSNEVLYSEDARQAIKAGIDKVANAVKVTLGPGGRNVVISRGSHWLPPIVTKDGVTVAREVRVEGGPEQLGAQLLRQAASKTNELSGDGTTTTSVLVQAMVDEGLKLVTVGRNGVRMKRGMDLAAARLCGAIAALATPLSLDDPDKLASVAAISGNDPEIGKTVSRAYLEVGVDGTVSFEQSRTSETVIEIHKGMVFEKGYASPYFITDPDKMCCELDDPYVLLYERRIGQAGELHSFLENFAKAYGPTATLLIISDEVAGDALATLVLNRTKAGKLWVAAKAPPGFGSKKKEWMKDLAAITGAEFIPEESGSKLETLPMTVLGRVKRAVLTSDSTTLIGGYGKPDLVEEHLASLKARLEAATDAGEADFLKTRIAKIAGGVALVRVGANTESELQERLHRYEDAISSTRAALRGGTVPGGGVAYLRAAAAVRALGEPELDDDELAGYDLVLGAMCAPLKTICENVGVSGDHILAQLEASKVRTGRRGRPTREQVATSRERSSFGYDAKNRRFVDLEEAGVIDPANVAKSVVSSSVSVAGTILTTEAAVFDLPKKDEPGSMQF